MLAMSLPMTAERVTPEIARKVASTFLNNNGAKSAQLTDLSKAAGFANLYIFTAEPGFVVMAADDCVQPILGYSLDGFILDEDMPDNVRGWLQGYDDEIQFAIDNQMRATAETAKQWKDLTEGNTKAGKATTVVPALLQTQWNQNGGYYSGTYVTLFNNLCPLKGNTRTVTGCVATAMAQIMKYWNQPAHGIGSHSYTWNNQTLSADFANTNYDWAHMTNTYGKNSTETEKLAVATLMYHCGVSVEMNYNTSGSGGSSASTAAVAEALKTYFNYSPDIVYRSKGDYTNDEWLNMVKTELDAGRPLQYRGSTGSGGGHSFVCDGYDSNNKFHFNWGWAGSYDGYFYLSNLNTGANTQTGAGNGDYTNDQAAIFGIQPATIGEAAAPTLTATLVQSTGIRNANLSWTAVSGAASYQLYYDCQLIYSGTETSFTHEHIPYGTSTYFVRSVDASGNLSWPSNYASISITFPGPANLTSVQSENGIQLSWDAADNAVSYNIFCNGILFANTTSTSYLDDRAIAGELKYFLKGVDALGDESDASEIATVNVAYSAPIVNSLSATLTNNDATLTWTAPKWCYPETHSNILTYGTGTPKGSFGYNNGTTKMYWGHRYFSSNLGSYNGFVLYKVSFYAKESGRYKIFVYQGTTSDAPQTMVLEQSINITTDSWNEIDLQNPIIIDSSQDLWVFIYDDEARSYAAVHSGEYSGDGNYYYYTDPTLGVWSLNRAFLIRTYLSDGTYTYNLYHDGEQIAQNLSQTSYNATLNDNAPNLFTVKTNYYGGETAASNTIGFAKGTASVANLEMAANDKMTITENSKLTVSDTVSNDNPANLILENGAQLIHSSNGVKATVKKAIVPYSGNDNGWNFIASPVAEDIIPNEENGLLSGNYDLYFYEEPSHMWRNYKEHIVDGINQNTASGFDLTHKKGYLYANEATTTLQFEGTLTPSNNSVTITGLSHENTELNGFNLVGNPFACNATIDKDFYEISGNSITMLAPTARQIAPCEGVMVKADSDQSTATFTKANSAKSNSNSQCLDLVVFQDKATLDRARVRFGNGTNMEKFSLDQDNTQISLWQDGQDYAVAYMGTDIARNVSTELPINFKAAENGTYTIVIETNSLDVDYLHLIDNMTGDDIDLLAASNYTFTAKSTDYASRFRLVFAPTEENLNNNDAPFAFVSNGEIVINGATDNASLQIVDVTGRVIRCTDAARHVSTNGIPAGVYVLRLIDGENVKVQKIVIE